MGNNNSTQPVYISNNNNLHWFVVYTCFKFEIFFNENKKEENILLSVKKIKNEDYKKLNYVLAGKTNFNLFDCYAFSKTILKTTTYSKLFNDCQHYACELATKLTNTTNYRLLTSSQFNSSLDETDINENIALYKTYNNDFNTFDNFLTNLVVEKEEKEEKNKITDKNNNNNKYNNNKNDENFNKLNKKIEMSVKEKLYIISLNDLIDNLKADINNLMIYKFPNKLDEELALPYTESSTNIASVNLIIVYAIYEHFFDSNNNLYNLSKQYCVKQTIMNKLALCATSKNIDETFSKLMTEYILNIPKMITHLEYSINLYNK